ncbi:MAG: hypothetical protein Q8K78_08710 [Planctomycetaceae bacterium]|nr:hypothetical protein [Planctomycetaceae bacterium]
MRAMVLGLIVTAIAAAPPVKKVPAGPAAVDVVSLKSGRSLRGAILQRNADRSITMAVSRGWLKTANPDLFDQQDALDLKTQREAWTQVRDRLKGLLKTPPKSQRLAFLLQSELDALENNLAAEEPQRAEFFWIELSGSQISRVTPATPERQKLAVIAWNEGFIDVETQDATTLQKELTKRKIPLDGPTPDISSRLPPRPQDDREWAARLAVVEYVYRQSLDFQGMGDTLVRTGEGQKPDLTALFQKLMKQQVDSVLKDLLNEGPARPEPIKPERELFAPAIAAAESAGSRGFRVTRLQMDPERNRVGVEVRFVAKLDENRWQTVWLTTEFADTTQPRPDIEAKIEQDPQVKSILETIKTVGLFDDAPLRTALRTGAATMSAMQSAEQAFFTFTNRYTQHIDRPKLLLPAVAP